MIQDLVGSKDNMVKVQVGEHNFYLDGYLKANLDTVKKDVKKDYDAFIIMAGREGFGKSTFAFQQAKYLDPTFNLDRVVFTADQFVEAVDNAEQYQAIVFDETMGYLSSRGSMSKFNRTLIKVMSEMRSKNLFIILCISNFFELDRYPAIHRSTGLIYIYKRASFGSYDYEKKKKLYLKGKKYYSYGVSPTFIGRCTKYKVLDWNKYEEKKQNAIAEWQKTKHKEEKSLNQRNILIKHLIDNELTSKSTISKLIDLSCGQIERIMAKWPAVL